MTNILQYECIHVDTKTDFSPIHYQLIDLLALRAW